MSNYDVAILGEGFSGSVASHYLSERNLKVALIKSPENLSTKQDSSAHTSTGDLITRIAHARGEHLAERVYNYHILGFQRVKELCKIFEIPYTIGQVTYIANTKFEKRELEILHNMLNRYGIASFLEQINDQSRSIYLIIPEASLICNLQLLEEHLLGDVSVFKSETKEIDLAPEGISIDLEVDNKIKSEILIVVDPTFLNKKCLNILNLYQQFIPYQDQRVIFSTQQAINNGWRNSTTSGSTLFWQSNLNQMAITGRFEVSTSGGRFLRHNFGTGSHLLSVEPKVSDFLEKEIERVLGVNSSFKVSYPFIDYRPRDELPLVGPTNDHRVLICSGYMGCGLSIGTAAGNSLARLITSGSCADLPQELWPKRLHNIR